jgi:hypothetical protein
MIAGGNGSAKRRRMPLPNLIKYGVSGTIAIYLSVTGQTAHAETRFFVEASTKIESSENRYLLVGQNTSSVALSASIAPSVVINDGTTEFQINGKIGYSEFLRRYASTESFALNGSVSQRLSPRLTFNAGLSFDSNVIGAGDLQTIRPTDPAIIAPPTAPGDIALDSLRKRRNALAGTLGVSFQATARDRWQIGSNFAFSRFPSAVVGTEYDQSGVSVSYTKSLSDQTSVGASLSVARIDYQKTRFGDSLTVSPQATFTTQLGLRWSLSGSAGVSVSSSRGLTGTITETSASGSANICRSGDRNQLCAFISRAIEPTLAGNVRPQTSIGGSYRLQLRDRTSLAASAGFTQSSSGGNRAQASTQFARALIVVTQRFSERFSATVSAGYNDSFKDLVQRRANYSTSIGLSYRLGDPR